MSRDSTEAEVVVVGIEEVSGEVLLISLIVQEEGLFLLFLSLRISHKQSIGVEVEGIECLIGARLENFLPFRNKIITKGRR